MNPRYKNLSAQICCGLALMSLAAMRSAAAESNAPPSAARMPVVLFDDIEHKENYDPAGWMGHFEGIQRNSAWKEKPQSGNTCIRIDVDPAGTWAGVAWQNPPKDWGELPGGLNLSQAEKLSFWARGEQGGERVKFGFALFHGIGLPYPDTAAPSPFTVTLTREWQRFEFDLKGLDLKRIKCGFVWFVEEQGGPVVFYLDAIQYEGATK